MAEPVKNERRRFPRVPVRAAVFHQDDMKDLAGMQYCHTRDVSKGGLAVEMKGPRKNWIDSLEPGKTMMSVEFTLPGFSSSVHASTRLVWLLRKKERGEKETTYAVGLEFMSILKQDREKIDTFVKEHQDG